MGFGGDVALRCWPGAFLISLSLWSHSLFIENFFWFINNQHLNEDSAEDISRL